MKPSPRIRVITVRQPQIARLMAGDLARVRRPMTKFAQFEAGNRLWVREPFHLEERFDHYSPTAAKELGAKPYFAADLQRDELPVRLGSQRFARTLLRVWHRQHLCGAWAQRILPRGQTSVVRSGIGRPAPAFSARGHRE